MPARFALNENDDVRHLKVQTEAIVTSSSNQNPVNGFSSIGATALLPAHNGGSRDPGTLIAASDSVASARICLRQGRRALNRSESNFRTIREDSPEELYKVRVGLALLRNYKSSFAIEQEILEIVDTYIEDLSSREGLDLQESNTIRLRLDALEERRETLISERRSMARSYQ